MSRQLVSADQDDLVKDLERNYRDRVSNVDLKSKQEIINYEALDESLHRQILALRNEIDNQNMKKNKALQVKKLQFDRELEACKAEKDREINEYTRKLQMAKEKLFSSKQEFEKARISLLQSKSEEESQNLKLRCSVSDLTKEIESIQNKLREVYSRDIHYAKQEIENLQQSYEMSSKKLQQDQFYEARELEFRVESCERTIENLMYDIDALKHEEEIVKEQTDRDISYLKESLLDSNRDVELCEEQTIHLVRGRDEAKDESLMMSKVTGELETALGKEMKINARLNGKLTKLERLVYGKGTRSPSKGRLI